MDQAGEEEDELLNLFESASSFVRNIAGTLSSETLLYLYARYKQVTEGPNKTAKPGFFDFQGKQKWEAWKKIGSKSKKEAMMEYISELSRLRPEWEDQMEKGEVKKASAFGVAISTMASQEEELSDDQKTIFDWCKEGNIKEVTSRLTSCQSDVNQTDEEGLSLLHWASDRGHADMVEALVRLNADVNMQDEDGQTPLHYASSCEHEAVIPILVSCGADTTLKDCSGLTPFEVAESQHIKALFTPPNG